MAAAGCSEKLEPPTKQYVTPKNITDITAMRTLIFLLFLEHMINIYSFPPLHSLSFGRRRQIYSLLPYSFYLTRLVTHRLLSLFLFNQLLSVSLYQKYTALSFPAAAKGKFSPSVVE